MPRSPRQLSLRSLNLLVGALGVLLPVVASAQADPLDDVSAMMREPDTRFVAVEFFASWCKPCVASIPKWRALQRRYPQHGLKVIVVSTQDKKGGCEDPGWSPDKVVCDEEGTLAEQFGANKLPSAYLWSWDGRLLARTASHNDVAAALKRAVKSSPRVAINIEGATSKTMKVRLRALLREQIGASKIRLVATAKQKRLIQRLLKEQHQAKFDEDMQCELGKALPPNALLSAELKAGRLQLSLVSAESGCVLALGSASWSATRARSSVRRASAQMLRRLTRPLEHPRGLAGRPIAQRRPPRRVAPEAGEVLVANFRSTPGGAVVYVADKRICGPTPCSGIVEAGAYELTFRREGFIEQKQNVRFSSDQLMASFRLKPKPETDLKAVLKKESQRRVVAEPPPSRTPPPVAAVRSPSHSARTVVLMPIDPQDHRNGQRRRQVDRLIAKSLKKLGYRVTVVPNSLAEKARIDSFPKDLRCARNCQKLLRERHPSALLVIPSYRPLKGRTKVLLALRVTSPEGKSHGTMVTPNDDDSKFETTVRTRLYSLVERMAGADG